MSYKPPIEMSICQKQIADDIRTKVDNDCWEATVKVLYDIHVEIPDRNEFLRAMAYDRNQYNKGYKDGLEAQSDDIKLLNFIRKYYPETYYLAKRHLDRGDTLYGETF